MDSIGVIGLGSTGAFVARRLLERGMPVTVHDRDAWAVAALAEAGARPARIPADAAEPADVVLVHLPDEAAAEEVLFDCGGVGETLHDGGIVVLAVTAAEPAFVRSVAARLDALGLAAVEAWFSGIEEGAGTVHAGCSPRELPAVRPLLDALGDAVVHTGPVGSVAALRRVRAALGAVPSAVTWPGGANDQPAFDPHRALQVVAGALADVWLAVRDALQDGLDLAHFDLAFAGPASRDAGERAAWSRKPAGISAPPHGVLSPQELMDTVVTVCGAEQSRPRATAGHRQADGNCLGLAPQDFTSVIQELERRFSLPLLPEAVRCNTPEEFVAMVNSQATSAA
jgi:3-hydroxyisobutyrate dehydrogenase-like beta-hydroxyacid dehydrogenase